jgi:2Fe-2S ferredoxin
MVRIVFLTPDEKRLEFDVPAGGTLMQAARDHNVPGIEAECGGCMACGTCPVVLEAVWYERLPPPTGPERDMLDYLVNPQPHMRLTCQVTVTDDLDGIVLRIPQAQH